MSYTPNTWKSGDVVTSAKLNNIEQGIANAGAMIVHNNDDTLDKTWQEIHDAAPLVWLQVEVIYAPVSQIAVGEGEYYVGFFDASGNTSYSFIASSADGYPVFLPE